MEALNLSNEFVARSYLRQLWPKLKELKFTNLITPILLSFPVSQRCFLSWLKTAHTHPFFYFRTRNQERELAGYGCYNSHKYPGISANDWHELITQHPQNDLLRLFFCQTFSAHEPWSEFAHMKYFLPQVCCERRGDEYWQTFILPLDQIKSLQDLEQRTKLLSEQCLINELEPLEPHLPKLIDRKDTPNFENWCTYFHSIMERINAGELLKVVPARRTDYYCAGKYDVFAILDQLMQLRQNVYNYIYSPKVGQYFLGGTPERLFSYADKMLKTEALAGTCADAASATQQDLFSDKNVREHYLVVEGLKARLTGLGCNKIQVSDVEVMQLSSMQHLHSRMHARSSRELLLEEIINSLHPTAAVCGEPQAKAAALIEELEPFARGLYAGPIGIADAHSIECAVALRSCLIQDDRVALFAGAGVVAGSEADKEWAELDTKISVIERLFE